VLDFRIPIRDWVSGAVSYLQTALGPLFDGFADAVDALIGGLLTALQWAPVPVVIVAFAALAALLAGWRVGLFALAGLFVVENVGLGQASNYAEVDGGSDIQLDVNNSTTAAIVYSRHEVSLQSGGVYTLFMVGDDAATANGVLRKDR